jgi:hypothetical protein
MISPSARFGAVLTVLWLATRATGTLQAQDQCRLDEVTKWRPRVSMYLADGIGAADRAVIESILGPAEALIRKTAYGTPRGFWVKPVWGHVGASRPNRRRTYSLSMVIYLRCNKLDEHGSDITITVNPNPQLWSEGDRPMLDEHGDGLYFNRVRTETPFGSTATYGHFEVENTEGVFVLFTRGGESPTIPVTREEYLRAMIFTLEGKDQEKLKEAATFMMKTQYQRWLEDAPARKKRHEEMLAGVASVDPSQATKTRADFEKADREACETLKKSDAQEREDLNRTRASLTVPGDKLRAQIVAMSPQERASPAFVFGNQELVPAGTPNAMAMVRADPAFYRALGSPFEPRAILVEMRGTHPELRDQHWQLYRELDWAALKSLVNGKP